MAEECHELLPCVKGALQACLSAKGQQENEAAYLA